jgi:hypothetical protein
MTPTSAPWEWRKGCGTVSLSLRGGSGSKDPPARKLAEALDTIQHYGQLRTVIYTDGLAVGGVKHGGSPAVVTPCNPGNPTFLDVRHQCGPEYTTSFEVEMWRLWLVLDCLDDEAIAAGVLIFSNSQWASKGEWTFIPLRPGPFVGSSKGPQGPCMLPMGPSSLRPSRERESG